MIDVDKHGVILYIKINKIVINKLVDKLVGTV